jgi:hypothetical protein
MNHKVIGFLSFLVVGALGCGQGTDPVSTLGDSSVSMANTLSLPVTTANTFYAYGAASDGFGFTTGLGAPVRAPANGLIIAIDSGGQTLTMMHNTRELTRYRNVTPTVQVGSYIFAGSQLGTVSTVGTVYLSVVVDGVTVCPLSYLSSAARATILTIVGGNINPCGQ